MKTQYIITRSDGSTYTKETWRVYDAVSSSGMKWTEINTIKVSNPNGLNADMIGKSLDEAMIMCDQATNVADRYLWDAIASHLGKIENELSKRKLKEGKVL